MHIPDVAPQRLVGILRGFVSSRNSMIWQATLRDRTSLSWFAFAPLIPDVIKQDLKLTSAQVGAYFLACVNMQMLIFCRKF